METEPRCQLLYITASESKRGSPTVGYDKMGMCNLKHTLFLPSKKTEYTKTNKKARKLNFYLKQQQRPTLFSSAIFHKHRGLYKEATSTYVQGYTS